MRFAVASCVALGPGEPMKPAKPHMFDQPQFGGVNRAFDRAEFITATTARRLQLRLLDHRRT